MLNDLIFDNPMLIEIRRFRRKYFSARGPAFVGTLFVVIGYLLLVMTCLTYATSMPPIAVFYLLLAFLCFLGPALMHGAIAGERERRSWDFLLVAPISKAQIVAGKFMSACYAIALCVALACVPLVITMLGSAYRPDYYTPYGSDLYTVNIYDLFLTFFVITSFALFVCALTLFFSARCRRPFMALGASLGSLILGLAVYPILVSPLMSGSSDLSMFLHPFVVMTHTSTAYESMRGSYQYEAPIPRELWGWPQIFVYLALTVIFLIWTERTLNWPENEVKFIGGGHHA